MNNVIPVCGSCGNGEVTIASHCEWDITLQQWIAQDPDEAGAYCSECSEEGNIEYKNIAIPVERMQITIPFDLHEFANDWYLDTAQEEFLSRTNGPAMDDRYDREISIVDVKFINDSHEVKGMDTKLILTVECMLTDNGGDE